MTEKKEKQKDERKNSGVKQKKNGCEETVKKERNYRKSQQVFKQKEDFFKNKNGKRKENEDFFFRDKNGESIKKKRANQNDKIREQ